MRRSVGHLWMASPNAQQWIQHIEFINIGSKSDKMIKGLAKVLYRAAHKESVKIKRKLREIECFSGEGVAVLGLSL